MDRAEEHFHKSLLASSRRLHALLQARAPKLPIADELNALLRAGLGFCGRELTSSLVESLIADARVRSGFCKSCENPAGKDGSCEQCTARLEDEGVALDRAWASIVVEEQRQLDQEEGPTNPFAS